MSLRDLGVLVACSLERPLSLDVGRLPVVDAFTGLHYVNLLSPGADAARAIQLCGKRWLLRLIYGRKKPSTEGKGQRWECVSHHLACLDWVVAQTIPDKNQMVDSEASGWTRGIVRQYAKGESENATPSATDSYFIRIVSDGVQR
ncbi:hypothetical protein ACTUVK_002832 [Stenotrophomonas rhizophila]